MSALKLTGVNKSFGKTQVLKDINLEVENGEFVVIVGPSGCGKSTLLRLIAGLEPASSGNVVIAGKPVDSVPPSRRGIAMVFQSYALYPHLNVRANMALALKQERKSKQVIAERIDYASRMLDLTAYLARYPSELSGGQRQRVAIGRAIVREPKLFLFDEPLSNLDAALRMSTRLEIAKLHKKLSTAMIYVTHDQIEAMTLADKIVLLRNGVIEQTGSPMDLYNNPANQFVAGFLGSPSMNFLPADLLKPHLLQPGHLHSGNTSTIGIRPEDFRIDSNGSLTATVLHVEQLGGDTNLVANINDTTVTVRLFGQHSIHEQQQIKLDFIDAKALYFDTDGNRIN